MYLADMYKEGVIHPESLTFDWNQWWGAYLQNKIGMWYHQPRRLSEMNGSLKKAGSHERQDVAHRPAQGTVRTGDLR